MSVFQRYRIDPGGRKVALYFTGWKRAGENLADVLKQRAAELEAPIQMCDAFVAELAELIETLLAECRYVLESLGAVYGFNAGAKDFGLTPEERLKFHQTHSGPVMEDMRQWMEAQFA